MLATFYGFARNEKETTTTMNSSLLSLAYAGLFSVVYIWPYVGMVLCHISCPRYHVMHYF